MKYNALWRGSNGALHLLTISLFVIIICIGNACNTSKKTGKAEKSKDREKSENKINKEWSGETKEAGLQENAKENIPSDNSEDGKIEDANKARSVIIGKWKWEKTICCGRRPEVIKPEDKNKEQFLVFKADSTVLFYKGDQIEKRKTYKIKQGALVNNIPSIRIEGQQTAILRLTNNQLVLDYSYIDLQTEYYKKVE